MTNQTAEIAQTLATKLIAAEDALDHAFRLTAELASYMPRARHEARVSIATGHEAIVSISQVLGKLGEARGGMLDAHGALAKAQHRIGLPEVNYGPFVDKPHRRQARGDLSIVGQRNAA